jgi:hypothetical protein
MSRISSKRMRKLIKEQKPKKMSESKRLKLIKGVENMMKKGVKDKGRTNKASMTKYCGRVFRVKL